MTPKEQIDKRITELNDWRGEMISKLRALIHQAEPNIIEEWKWDTPVFSLNGQVCALGSFKDHVKINFFKGAQLEDKNKLINAGLDSKSHRSIDFHQGDSINATALIELIKEAVGLNTKKK
jgi:hypothetical protein